MNTAAPTSPATSSLPVVRALPLGGSTLGALLDRRARFAFASDGSIDARSQAATRLLDGPAGEATRRVLEGMRTLVVDDARAAGTSDALLAGVSLSSDAEGWAANKLATFLDTGVIASRDADNPTWRTLATDVFDDQRARAATEGGGVAASYTRGWLDLGPIPSQAIGVQLVGGSGDAARDTQLGTIASYQVTHELGHAVTPTESTDPVVRAREEGIAETLARWPGAVARAATAMGLPGGPLAGDVAFDRSASGTPLDQLVAHPYDRPTQAVRAVLAVADIDIDAPAARADAVRALQSVPSTDVPHHLAERLVGTADAATLEPFVAAALADADAVAALRAQLDALRAASSGRDA